MLGAPLDIISVSTCQALPCLFWDKPHIFYNFQALFVRWSGKLTPAHCRKGNVRLCVRRSQVAANGSVVIYLKEAWHLHTGIIRCPADPNAQSTVSACAGIPRIMLQPSDFGRGRGCSYWAYCRCTIRNLIRSTMSFLSNFLWPRERAVCGNRHASRRFIPRQVGLCLSKRDIPDPDTPDDPGFR